MDVRLIQNAPAEFERRLIGSYFFPSTFGFHLRSTLPGCRKPALGLNDLRAGGGGQCHGFPVSSSMEDDEAPAPYAYACAGTVCWP